jgi:type IV pilus assembly protein PilB
LRQDPNIIMVGEIRDVETADLGVQAALTGHLVFSTLHTNDAATSLPRLLDMGIEPFLIASVTRAIVGQRLVRRLRHETRISYQPTQEEQALIVKMFNVPAGQDFSYIHEIEKKAASEGLGGDTPLSTDETGIKTLWKNDESDNSDGAQNGYRGRIGIYETLKNSETIQKLIVANATSSQIREQAVREGMMTMQVDGLIKVLRGETTLDEVIRATKE